MSEDVPHLTSFSGSSPSNRLGLASALFRDGQFERAWQELTLALKENPELADGQLIKGMMLAGCREYSQAVAPLQFAIELNPDAEIPYMVLARTFKELGQPDHALKTLSHLLERKPDYAAALALKGTILQEVEKLDQALAAWQKACQSSNPESRFHLATALIHRSAGRWTEAILELDKAHMLSPQDPGLFLAKIDVLHALGQSNAAAALTRTALSGAPLYAPFYHRLACWFWENDQPTAAMGLLRTALQLDSALTEAHVLLATILKSLGRNKESRQFLSRSQRKRAPIASETV